MKTLKIIRLIIEFLFNNKILLVLGSKALIVLYTIVSLDGSNFEMVEFLRILFYVLLVYYILVAFISTTPISWTVSNENEYPSIFSIGNIEDETLIRICSIKEVLYRMNMSYLNNGNFQSKETVDNNKATLDLFIIFLGFFIIFLHEFSFFYSPYYQLLPISIFLFLTLFCIHRIRFRREVMLINPKGDIRLIMIKISTLIYFYILIKSIFWPLNYTFYGIFPSVKTTSNEVLIVSEKGYHDFDVEIKAEIYKTLIPSIIPTNKYIITSIIPTDTNTISSIFDNIEEDQESGGFTFKYYSSKQNKVLFIRKRISYF